MLDKFKDFLTDKEASELYITGVAGTGKTTSLKHIVDDCMENNLKVVTTAYTHKACGVLRDKLSKGSEIMTLHSFLRKRPTINTHATKVKNLESNTQMAAPDRFKVVFIDEFSMVGERDYADLKEMQYDEEGNLVTKIVWIGDPNQLPPVKDQIVVEPKEPWWIKLTTIHRQAEDNKLIDTLLQINDFINGAPITSIPEHENFIRGQDIVDLYTRCNKTKILLAYTNERVEELNAHIQGRKLPEINDRMFCPTIRQYGVLEGIEPFADSIVKINGELLEMGSKYKTLETLHELPDISFYYVANDEGIYTYRAVVFGHYQYKLVNEMLGKRAAETNRQIEKISNGEPAKSWAFKNWKHPFAKARKEAWRYYLAFKDCVVCMDFPHAMTVHKSQGSTYEYVFLDTEDIYKCAKMDFKLYLKLMYVGVSRASLKVFTN